VDHNDEPAEFARRVRAGSRSGIRCTALYARTRGSRGRPAITSGFAVRSVVDQLVAPKLRLGAGGCPQRERPARRQCHTVRRLGSGSSCPPNQLGARVGADRRDDPSLRRSSGNPRCLPCQPWKAFWTVRVIEVHGHERDEVRCPPESWTEPFGGTTGRTFGRAPDQCRGASADESYLRFRAGRLAIAAPEKT
jgi:hypothetical protein